VGSRHREIYVAAFPEPGDPQRVTTMGGIWPQWRDDGRELFYIAADGTLTAIDVVPSVSQLRFGTPRALFRISSESTDKPYSPAPDGQRFLVATSVGEATTAPLTLLVRRW
jgi:hypothetical protein